MPSLSIDGREGERARRDHGHPGRGGAGDLHSSLLLPPRPLDRRQLPYLPRRDRKQPQAPDRLQPAR